MIVEPAWRGPATDARRRAPTQWPPVTPARAAGLTDHGWTMEELLRYRVPPDFRDRLEQQATHNTA